MIILLSISNRAIIRQNFHEYTKALKMYMAHDFQTNVPLGLFV